ncbi:MAG: diacylglycerol kinase family protein [bacterium]|nr:diacylglycerol kinase family protein [bacterium]
MSRFKAQGFNNTFKNARKGFRLVFKSETNIKIHILIAALVIFAGYFFEFDAIEFCILLIAIALVIVSEMLNTAIEFALDSIYHNKYSKMVGMAKDISAGAVMIASVISVIIGLLLFGNHLI